MDNGSMIKLMALESIVILMELSMKDIGKKINNMVMDQKPGQMVPDMKANTFKEKNMGLEGLHGLMEVLIMDNSQKIISKEQASIIGLMEENMKALG